MVVCCQRTVTKDITHIRGAQHVEASPHVQVVDRSLHQGKDIDEGLAIRHTLGILLGTDELEVTGSHAHIDHHVVKVGEIDGTLDIQRVLVIGIDGEVLEQQLGLCDAHRVIVEAQLHTIGLTLDIRRVEVYLTVDLRT